MPNKKRLTRRIWKPAEIQRIATEYCIQGTVKGTARKTKCPESTIRDWRDKNNEHWDGAITLYRDLKKDQYVAMADAIIDKAGEVALAKLEDCDARSAATVGGIYYDKRQTALQLPSAYRASDATMIGLAQQFRDMAAEHKRIQADHDNIQGTVINKDEEGSIE